MNSAERTFCAYCGKVNDAPSDEHVIPEALGGRLITRQVCRSCNSKMGSEVDAPLSESLILRLLRFNFKDYLPTAAIPNFTLDADLVSPNGSDRIAGRIRFSSDGIAFEQAFDQKVDGKRTTYIVPDTLEGRKAYQGILNSPSKNITDAGWYDLPEYRDSLVLNEPGYLRYQKPLIKILLGFIAEEVSSGLAIDARFDIARRFIQGEIDDLSGHGYAMRTGVTKAAIALMKSVGHEIGFTVDNGFAVFSVTLFDALRLQVKVEVQLPVIPAVKRRYILNRRRNTLGVPVFRLLPP